MNKRWPYNCPGIPDYLFERARGVPMTKQEIRAVIVSRLRPFPGITVYDVGAGTGSVSIECARAGCAEIFAVENDAEALQVLKNNLAAFEAARVRVVAGRAPEALQGLPEADRVFVGGSGGYLLSILEKTREKLKPGGRLVVSSVTLDTGPRVVNFLEESGFSDIDITSINVSRAVPRGGVYLWQAQNPVQVISAQKGEN